MIQVRRSQWFKALKPSAGIFLACLLGIAAAVVLVASAAWALRGTPVGRVPAAEFEVRYRRLARQMLAVHRETTSEWRVRQLPCEAGYRTRHPGIVRVGGTLALKIEISAGRARVVELESTGGDFDQPLLICLHQAWTWLVRSYPLDRSVPDEVFWTPWIWTAKLRSNYPPLPSEWLDPGRWSPAYPKGWETVVARTIEPIEKPVHGPTSVSLAAPISLAEMIRSFPLLSDEIYDAVFSTEAQAKRSLQPCLALRPPGANLAGPDVLEVSVRIWDGKAYVEPKAVRSSPDDTRYASCVLRAIGLRSGQYSVPGSFDSAFVVEFPFDLTSAAR
jgi:hypothetical protein